MHGEMTQPGFGGARAGFAARLAMLALAMLLPAVALAQAGGAPKGNPRLVSLSIEILPEYDRPAALVILKGALAEGVKPPVAVTLRLPAASGGPSAVAFSAAVDSKLLNLNHERAVTGEFVTLKFEMPERFFHVEFYEPIATTLPARSYRYTWPGDFTADRVAVVVQEPALTNDMSVEPNLELLSTGRDGMRYRAAELGALEAGKPLPIVVRYTKLDMRPSVEIVKPKAGDPALAAAAPPLAAAATGASAGAGPPFPVSVLVLLAVALIAVGAMLIFLWWRRRRAPPASLPHGACTQCGAARLPGNRFCGKCGAKLA